MRVYAVVGGIASGKSTVCRLLARRGGTVIDVDALGHRALRIPRVVQELSRRFGADIVGADGALDRRALGKRVFGKPARLRDLNLIVHPEIGRLLRRRLAALARRGVAYAVIDAALFLDVDLGVDADAVVAVCAPRAVRRKRLRARDALSGAECEARLSSQPRLGVWTRQADFTIDTRGSRSQVEERVNELWPQLQRFRGQRRRGGS
jgi:dephospho-CoA kinase